MATLEIHDDQGRVQRVAVSREHPALFGSNPECDIVLQGQGVLPVHGRIRWKGGRFKVDASPEARSIERNGKKVTTASFRIGDEVRVGSFRMFMINPDTGPLDEKTRLLAPPRPAHSASPYAEKFESMEWVGSLEGAQHSAEVTAVASTKADPMETTYDRALHDALARRGAQVAAIPRRSLWQRIVTLLAAGSDRPGQERILTSPLVIGLVGTLVVLTGLGFWLHHIIVRTAAERLFSHAVQSLDDGEYRNAMAQFDDFLKANPEHEHVGKARVLRHLAEVRQYVMGGSPSWSNALSAEQAMYNQTRKLPEFRDEGNDLAEMVLKTAIGLADRTRTETDPKTQAKLLKETESAITLHDQVAGKPAETLRAKSPLPNKLEQARAAARKGAARLAALAEMDKALKESSADGVYASRDRLVASYPDLANAREVIDRLRQANELIRSAARFDESRRAAETEPNPEPLSPPVSLVLRTNPGDRPENQSGPVVYAIAEGLAYGVDGLTGAPLWQQQVGISSPFAPQAIPGNEPAVLAFDARHNELVRLAGRTGKLVWRQPLEEPITVPPLILGNQAIQPTPTGNLLFLDLTTGELTGTMVLGRPLGQTPASDEAGQFFYVPAEEANLFIVKRDPVECTAVEYLGHAPGSLLGPPARLGKFLVVAENTTLADSRSTVFELFDEGAKIRPLQRVDVEGWTWGAPTSQGSTLWAIGDRGSMVAFSIGEGKVPLQEVARLSSESQTTGPAFARARTEREVWVASGRPGRYDLDIERARINPVWTLSDVGPALAPVQVAGKLIVFTQQSKTDRAVELWGVDPTNGNLRWKTVLGAPWPLVPAPAGSGTGLSTVATDGQRLLLDRKLLEQGGFVEQQLPKPGQIRLPHGPLVRLDAGELTLVVPPRNGTKILVREGQEELREVELPAPLGAAPMFWGDDLLVPGGDGRVYLIDPKTGASKAEPFVPPYDREHPIRWLAPARLDADAIVLADEVGTVRRMTLKKEPRPRLIVQAETSLNATLSTDPVATEEAIVLVTAEGRVRALASRDLSPLGAWPLEAPRAVGPVISRGYTFVADTAGRLIAFGANGDRLWSIDLKAEVPAGPPVVQEPTALFLGRDGALERRSLSDGSSQERRMLGVVPTGGLSALGADVIVPVAPGTLRLLAAPPTPSAEK